MFTIHIFIKGTVFILVGGSMAAAIAAEEAVRAPVKANSSATERDERGRYLVKITGCTEQDLRAIYRFIRNMGPAGKPEPAYLPPEKEPQGPYILFPQTPK